MIAGNVIDSLFSSTVNSQAQYDSLAASALSRGIDFYTKENYSDAVREFKRAAGLAPFSENAAKAYDFMGRAYLMDNNAEQAVKAYKEAIRIYPVRDSFHLSLGDIYAKNGQTAEAETEYTTAVKLTPDSPENRYALGQIYLTSGRYAEAQVQFTKLTVLSPSSSTGYYGLGQTFRKKGAYQDAINHLNKAIALDRNFSNAYLELGYTYADIGDMDKAQEQAKILSDKGSPANSLLQSYIHQISRPRILFAYSTNGFNQSLGPNTSVASLGSSLADPGSTQIFTMRFGFTKDMDVISVQNLFNWNISRASGTTVGGGYNWGLGIPSSEALISSIPESVYYDKDSGIADINFRVTQNAAADSTIDPGHIVFKFHGIDVYGKTIDPAADEYSGFSMIA